MGKESLNKLIIIQRPDNKKYTLQPLRTKHMEQNKLNTILNNLYKRQSFGIKPGLGVETRLLENLGNPQNSYAIIHIAGTNGKGSTAAMLESTLRNVGIQTALYTSPHLIKFNERIMCNGEYITDDELCELIQIVESADTENATFFEFATAMAFKFFEQQKIQIAIIETGLGGRLDATNVVKPMLTIITNISQDHSEYLGNTIEEVAEEKAGIVKDKTPVIIAKMPDEATNKIKEVASSKHAAVIRAEENVSISIGERSIDNIKLNVSTENAVYGKLKLPFGAEYQIDNLASVLTAVEYVFNTLDIELPIKKIKEGIKKTKWAGRFQLINDDPKIIFDGAHNSDAARRLVETLDSLRDGNDVVYIVGMCKDKDNYNFLKQLKNSAKLVLLVELNNQRTAKKDSLEEICKTLNIKTEQTTLDKALNQAKKIAQEDNMICITGSLFLAQEFLER
jgi:dihydrofolate synthase/folylpolyglutamate synthase